MAIQRRFCKNHPDRLAIGVCVITQDAICGECSTRYEGVNYSREGLRILQERRRAQEDPRRGTLSHGLLILFAPVPLLLLFWFYDLSVNIFMALIHREWN